MASSTKETLQHLASKQNEWQSMPLERKLAYLERMLSTFVSNSEAWKETGRRAASSECMGYPLSTPEGQLEASSQYMLLVFMLKQHWTHLIASYKVILGQAAKPKELVVQQKTNGQVTVKVFPILPSEKMGPSGKGTAEMYLDPEHVKSESDVDMFNLKHFQENMQVPGAYVVLGAGNQGFLTVSDVLQALFVWNRVVLVKHHPLREYQDSMIRQIFAPLIEEGFMECQFDATFDRSAFYSSPELIAGVHMTGGKATHDAIVWGSMKKEQRAKQQPLLKPTITSELGCITPWIFSPYEYSIKELESQVLGLFFAAYNNCSCNCNAPKVIVVSESWKQLPDFIKMLTEYLDSRNVPAAYYPGTKERWEGYSKMYPGALHLGRGLDAKERKLEKPALPWLLVQVEIDLTTAEGRAAAQREYAFLNEPFAPVLTIATIKGCSGDTFLKTASTLCNNYLFGTLSASLTVPDNKLNDVNVEECLSSMRYGSIVLNAWSAQCYGLLGCSWGAYPGETLADVQSGIGQIHNFWFIPHAQKCVLRLPCVTSANDLFKNDNPVRGTLLYTRLGDFLLNPGVGTFFKFIVAQMDGVKLAVGGAGMVGISAFILKKLLK